MSRRLPITAVLPLLLTGCEFTSVIDAFSSATEDYAPHAAAVDDDGNLYVVQEDGADVSVDIYDDAGSRLHAVDIPALYDAAGMATNPTSGEPTVVGRVNGDGIVAYRIDPHGQATAGLALDLSSRGFYSVHEVCDVAFAPDGTMLLTARRSFTVGGQRHWGTYLLELQRSPRVTGSSTLSYSSTGPTDCALLSHDQDEDLTWTALPGAGEVRAWDARLNQADRFSLNGSGDVEDIAAEGGLLAIARDRGSSHVLELYHDGARYDVLGVDGTTALAADRTGAVPSDCAADGGRLWRVHTDRDRTNLHGHSVCE